MKQHKSLPVIVGILLGAMSIAAQAATPPAHPMGPPSGVHPTFTPPAGFTPPARPALPTGATVPTRPTMPPTGMVRPTGMTRPAGAPDHPVKPK